MNKQLGNRQQVLDDAKRTAIFYSVPELTEYLVEVHYLGDHYFLGRKKPTRYANLDDARFAARKHHVDEAFLALSKDYQEVAPFTEGESLRNDRFDYVPTVV